MLPDLPNHIQSIFQCPLCDSIPMEEREGFLSNVKYSVRNYEAGDMLVAQGARYEMLYILIKGEIVTEISDEKGDFTKIEQIKAPNPVATGFLFAENNLSPVTALAVTPCVAILIPKENVYFLMCRYEEFMKAFLTYISNKVAFLSEKLRMASLRTIKAKVAYYLLRESKGENLVKLRTTKEDLSRLFGVSRPALVNVMMQMASEGIIAVDGRKITIEDRNQLQKIL